MLLKAAAVVIGCLILFLAWKRYGGRLKLKIRKGEGE